MAVKLTLEFFHWSTQVSACFYLSSLQTPLMVTPTAKRDHHGYIHFIFIYQGYMKMKLVH